MRCIVQLYALFKQGNQDPKFEDAPKAGAFDFKVRSDPPKA
jgi:diazepam-binding inhibitor (GABA receptor modulating acyl-CoA-binding protein)